MVQLLPRARTLNPARKSRALLLQQRVQCGLAVAVAKCVEQLVHECQPLRRRSGNRDPPVVSVCWTQPAPQFAAGGAVHPTNLRQPVAWAGQRTDRVPAQRRRLESRLDIAATPPRDRMLQYGEEVLAQTERVPEEVGALATA